MKRKEVYCDHGYAHPGARVRRLGLPARRRDPTRFRRPRATGAACPMGGDLIEAPRGGAPRFMIRALRDPGRCQPRSHPDHQGLARCRWQDPRAHLRRRRFRRARDRRGWPVQAPVGQHRRHREGDLHEHDRGCPDGAYWQDPDFDPNESGVLLRSRARDTHAALDDLRRSVLRNQAAGQRAGHDPGPRLYVADLVYAMSRRRRPQSRLARCTTFRVEQGRLGSNHRPVGTSRNRVVALVSADVVTVM